MIETAPGAHQVHLFLYRHVLVGRAERVYLHEFRLLSFGHKLALLSSMSLEAKRGGQFIDGEVQELPSGREIPDVVPTRLRCRITKA
jgi:hypothetical protein